jgi:RNA polymerase sigma factor (sigma-70 family)
VAARPIDDGDVKMRVGATSQPDLVVAARAGDRGAVDELLTANLPLVYTIVRRALGPDPDADDVVQEVMLRALRHLPALRRPERFRIWLVAITVHQVSTHLRRRDAGDRRHAALEEAGDLADPGAAIEDLTLLRLELSVQRRQVAQAGQWLDPDHRLLLSLWLLESAGELSRADVAESLGIRVAHAGVRIQRMRRQLEQGRQLVAALEARPRCTGLRAAAAGWDGVPRPLWRKRLVRHTRGCPVCRAAGAGAVPVEVLLPGFVPLAVPAGLAAGVLSGVADEAGVPPPAPVAGGAAPSRTVPGAVDHYARSVATHPVGVASVVSALAVGVAVVVSVSPVPSWISSWPPVGSAASPVNGPAGEPAGPSGPRPDPAVLPERGRATSLESAAAPGRFVTVDHDVALLAPRQAGDASTFTALAGLSDRDCFSFRSADGRYLRHSSWRFRLDPDVGTSLFRGDATFCVRTGALPGSVSLESGNYPGWFLRRLGTELWVDRSDGSPTFRTESSFRFRPAAGG